MTRPPSDPSNGSTQLSAPSKQGPQASSTRNRPYMVGFASSLSPETRVYIDHVESLDHVESPVRLTIPTCTGCGAMRVYESCDGICRERKLELVRALEYDELADAATAQQARLEDFEAVVEQLLDADPAADELRSTYESLRQAARSVLHGYAAQDVSEAASAVPDPAAPVDKVTVWRCPECGGVDAPQPCLDICIWGPAEWVRADLYESERARGADQRQRERALVALLRPLALATPHEGAWERNWEALRERARDLPGSARKPLSVD